MLALLLDVDERDLEGRLHPMNFDNHFQAYFFEYWSTRRLGPGPETNILAELPSSLRATVSLEKTCIPRPTGICWRDKHTSQGIMCMGKQINEKPGLCSEWQRQNVDQPRPCLSCIHAYMRAGPGLA